MRYREYRRKCKKTKDKKLARIADFRGYPSPACKMRVLQDGEKKYVGNNRSFIRLERCDNLDGFTYIKRLYRGKLSSALKKLYARQLRRGKNKMILFNGCDYKRASGDFWWDYC